MKNYMLIFKFYFFIWFFLLLVLKSLHKSSVWPGLSLDSSYRFEPLLGGFGSVLRIIHCERFTYGSNSSFGQMVSNYLQALFDIMQNSQMNHLLQAAIPRGWKATPNLSFFTTKFHRWYDIHEKLSLVYAQHIYCYCGQTSSIFDASVRSTLCHEASGQIVKLFADSRVNL